MAGPALALACLQAVGSGGLIWASLRRQRWLGIAVAALLLCGIGVGARFSPAVGLLAATGLSHAVLYAGLLAVFGRSLLPGRVALVTVLAQRTNKRFRPAMVPYTRGVTLAWCVFAGLQLVASAALLVAGRFGAWQLLVTLLHPLMAIALALLEYAVRCSRFPGEHASFAETVRAVRAGGLS